MTQKSPARRAKDAAAGRTNKYSKRLAHRTGQTDRSWDELATQHENCKQLISSHAVLAHTFSNVEIAAAAPEPKHLASLLKVLAKDLRELNDTLDKLGTLHLDKKGGARTPDEGMHAKHLMEQYVLLIQLHDANVMPVAMEVREILEVSMQKIHDQGLAMAIADHNAATDNAPIPAEALPASVAMAAQPQAEAVAQA